MTPHTATLSRAERRTLLALSFIAGVLIAFGFAF
jgi:hypothetical protein